LASRTTHDDTPNSATARSTASARIGLTTAVSCFMFP
jgi:hypothetical protein